MTTGLRKKLLATALAGVTGIAGAGVVGITSPLAAQEPRGEQAENAGLRRRELQLVAVAKASKHWIGVHATPVADEALQSHLQLDERLIVRQVLPESPAAKAGVQRHDILFKLGDKEIHTLEDLIQAVDANANQRADLTVMRGGKKVTVEVEPVERPQGEMAVARSEVSPEDLRIWMKEHLDDGPGRGRYILRMLGPGIVASEALQVAQAPVFPDGLSVTISKEAGQPRKVVATLDGKTYEATADKLDALPENIRPHVAQMLSGIPLRAYAEPWEFKARAELDGEVRDAMEKAKQAAAAVGQGAQQVETNRGQGAWEAVLQELRNLRKDVDELKGTNSEPAKPSKKSSQ